MTAFDDGFVLIGGFKIGELRTNEVWKGILKDDEITFENLPPMKHKRSYHFSFSLHGKNFVFGGEENRKENSHIEVFDGEKWIEGPQLPCYMSTTTSFVTNKCDNAVTNRDGKIILLSDKLGIGILDPETLSINFFNSEFKLRDKRSYFASILI